MVMVMIMALSTTEVRFISFVSAESRVSSLHSLGAVMCALRRVVSLPVAFLLQLTVLSSASIEPTAVISIVKIII